ncbi:GNAT family N-acetyltransferase [Flavobacterium sp. SM15]|uniref:GNAT family N-acetyltransferase n=1 Tax=Flavobacterium sp. SM15 TaxID=2908005 RepID=UPI001EDA7F77|nr:GNAT family N-acetyltransferase [Flavobacterium sp. SM15]MCG2611847.1 GNAT family N-acetyltransferase [Flavobacterium sp. SM15]
MITIKEISSQKELKEFILFSFELFKNNPYWIPPIIADELESFNKDKNPAFKNADVHFYLAYKNGKIAGKIIAIINWDEVNLLGKKKVRFGWFDAIDDIEVTKALLNKVSEFGKQQGMDHIEGPMGFSNLDKVGVLTEGFDQLGTMISWYSPPYYKEHFEKLGMVKEKEYFESYFSMEAVNPEPFQRASKMIKERYGLKVLNFKKSEEVMPYVDQMFDLFNSTYSSLQSFVAINDETKEYFKKKYISFINPEYIKFIIDKDEKMIGFTVVMPSFERALQKAKGKLFPFGFIHLLQAKKNAKEVVFYLIGVSPEYQNKGITAVIFDEYYKVFKEKGIKRFIRTPELEENHAMHNLWKNFDPTIHKRRRTYRKEI